MLGISKVHVSNYLTFFETLYLLIEDGVLSLEVVDNLFAYRFFLAVHSKFVQESKLLAQPENFINIYRLEHDWIEYRKSIGKVSKEGSVYASRQLKTLVSEEFYSEFIENNKVIKKEKQKKNK